MDKIKAIFFDADDTLINHKECERQALVFLFNHINITYKEEYHTIFRPLDRMLWDNESYDGTIISKNDIPTYRFKLLFENIRINYDDYDNANELFKEGLALSTALIENADTIVGYLHNRGYILCVVTNGLTKLQKPRIINSKIGSFISHVIVSEEVGASKPNPLIFNTLLKKINLNPNNVIMIGDSLKNDIQGARNANIKNIWYNPNHLKNDTNIIPDYVINNLLQLKNLI